MKKILKIIIPVFIIIAFIFSFLSFSVDAEGEIKYSNGDLRCPPQYLNNGCTEIPGGDGKIVEVQVSFNQSGINVIKHVAKTEILGVYNVWFTVDGDQSTVVKQTSGSANILLVLDNSSSIRYRYNDYIVPAAKQFANNLNLANNDGINLGIIAFNNEPLIIRGFEHNNFDNIAPLNWKPNCAKSNIPAEYNGDVKKYNQAITSNASVNSSCIDSQGNKGCYKDGDHCVYAGSHIEKALSSAYIMFSNAGYIGGNVPNYLIVMGDGKYSSDKASLEETWNAVVNHSDQGFNNLTNNGVVIYSIGFGLALSNQTYGDVMRRFSGNDPARYIALTADDNISNYTFVFDSIAQSISSQIKTTTFSVKIKDRIGSDFDIVGSTARTKTFEGNSFPFTTEVFQIAIDQTLADENNPWYDTNNGFDVIGYDSSSINPQVYWNNPFEYKSCSSALSQKYTYRDRTTNEYTSIRCNHVFESNLISDNMPIGSKVIDLNNSRGFPVEISLSASTTCDYSFNYPEFLYDYNVTQNEMITYPEGSRERTYYEKIIDRMNGYLQYWAAISNIDPNDVNKKPISSLLNNYQESFNKSISSGNVIIQDKTLNPSMTKVFNLVTKEGSFTIEKTDPIATNAISLLGVNFYPNIQFALHMNKTLELPVACLSMVNGEIVECNNSSNNQISGDNKIFIPLSLSTGYLSAEVRDATINGAKLKLNGPNDGINPYCEFNNHPNDNDVLFRQIELSDPFVQTYTNNQRNIGKNWMGNKYDFTNTIKSDTWSKDYEYQYTMSKRNVSSIKRNSTSNGVISYLGDNCKFRDGDNVYICPFIRPSSSGILNNKSSSNIYFTHINIHEKK